MTDENLDEKSTTTDESQEDSQNVDENSDDFDKDRAMATIRKLRIFEREAKKLQKQVDQYEQERQDAADSELSELERTKKQLAESKTKLAALELSQLRQEVAAEVGLPAKLAARIQGDDREAMVEDAKSLLEIVSPEDEQEDDKQDETRPKIRTTRVGGNQEQKETDAQKRARIFGGNTAIFDPIAAVQHGGGVVTNFEENQ